MKSKRNGAKVLLVKLNVLKRVLGICRGAEREPLTTDWKETVYLRTSRRLDHQLFIPSSSTLQEAEPVDSTDVEPVDPTDVEPVDPTDVEPVDPTDVEPVDPTDVEPAGSTDVEPVEERPVRS